MAIPVDREEQASLARTAKKRRFFSGAAVFAAMVTYWSVRLTIFLAVGMTEENYARKVMVPYIAPLLSAGCLLLGLAGQKVTRSLGGRFMFSVASGAAVAVASAVTIC